MIRHRSRRGTAGRWHTGRLGPGEHGVRGVLAGRGVAGKRRGQSGSATLELVVLAVPLTMVLALAIAAGRVAIAGGSVEAAARDAARQASIARDPATARSKATESALAALRSEGLSCAPNVSVDTSGLSRQVGTNASVTVRVTCPVKLSDLLLGVPGTKTMSAAFTSPIDPFRGR